MEVGRLEEQRGSGAGVSVESKYKQMLLGLWQ